MVEGDDGHAVNFAIEAVERGGQNVTIENVDVRQPDPHVLVGDIVGRGVHPLLQCLHESVGAGRQDELKAVVAPAREPRGKPVGAVFEPVDRLLHPLRRVGMDARPAIEDAIDRRQADPGGPRDILKRRAAH